MATMPVTMAASVEPDGTVGDSWGKARSVVVAQVRDGEFVEWRRHEVAWDVVHDEGTPGAHHARVVSFLRANGVQAVLVDHVGAGMRRMLASMGIHLVEHVAGDARTAMLEVADQWRPSPSA